MIFVLTEPGLQRCANCHRKLDDPVSKARGIGPDCWRTIDAEWRESIERRLAEAQTVTVAATAKGIAGR